MSIPVFFEPVVHATRARARTHVIVDGGMLSNFPVWLFDCRGPRPALADVRADARRAATRKVPSATGSPREEHGVARGSLLDYVKALASTMMEAHDRLYLEEATFARTIPIPTLGVGTTEFDITPERVQALYASGHKAATDFLDRWDFDAYIEEFRRGKDHSRRVGRPSPSLAEDRHVLLADGARRRRRAGRRGSARSRRRRTPTGTATCGPSRAPSAAPSSAAGRRRSARPRSGVAGSNRLPTTSTGLAVRRLNGPM